MPHGWTVGRTGGRTGPNQESPVDVRRINLGKHRARRMSKHRARRMMSKHRAGRMLSKHRARRMLSKLGQAWAACSIAGGLEVSTPWASGPLSGAMVGPVAGPLAGSVAAAPAFEAHHAAVTYAAPPVEVHPAMTYAAAPVTYAAAPRGAWA